jgi:hypothetical protein
MVARCRRLAAGRGFNVVSLMPSNQSADLPRLILKEFFERARCRNGSGLD